MSRSVPEWIGKHDDQAPPPRVRTRVFDRCEGQCHSCGRTIAPGDKWTLEHVIALVNGGANRESNLGLTCEWCLPGKNAADVAEKSYVYRKRSKHIGAVNKRPFPGGKGDKWKRKVDGTTVPRLENQDV